MNKKRVMKQFLWHSGKRLFAVICLIGTGTFATAAEINFGINRPDAAQYNTEFVQYDELAKFYKGNGIQASLFANRMLTYAPYIPQLADELKKFHVVNIQNPEEGIHQLTPDKRENARKVGAILADYVREGGGLVVQFRPTRYPNDDDDQYWNIVFEAFGMHQPKEGVADPARLVTADQKTAFKAQFFYTGAIDKHDVTEGVRGLWLPVTSYYPAAGVPLIEYSSDWTVVVRGEPTAKTFRVNSMNVLELDKSGTVDSAPPIVAVRQFGKGRVVSIAIDLIYTGQNLNKPTWSHRVEKGTDDKPSDVMTLMKNAIQWASAPARENKELGTYVLPDYKPIEFPASVVIKPIFVSDKKNQVKGVIGLHSNFTDGKSSVAEYVATAKAAGLTFVGFTDPLEQLTEEQFNAFRQACLDASSDEFYVCPGVEFTDASGIRWIFLGEKVSYPVAAPFKKDPYTYNLWDGKVIQHYGTYAAQCAYPVSAIVNYKDLDDSKVRRENLWWFFNIIPYAYQGDKLLADNYENWKFALSDLRQVVPLSYTQIASATEIPIAAKTAAQVVGNIADARAMLNTRCTWWRQAAAVRPFVSYGDSVMIDNFTVVNFQADPRVLHTRGVQRIPVRFAVSSENGIDEVKVINGDDGPVRIFHGRGAKSFAREFEMVLDKQRYVFLEATDTRGNKAISNFVMIFDYKQGLFRCGDNLNILGPLGYCWHPDRQELLPLVKDFRNAEVFSVQGWDRGSPDCPYPSGWLMNMARIAGTGEYPSFTPDSMGAMRMRVRLAGGDMQIVDATMDEISERYDNAQRPGPPQASPARILGENEYFAHTQRMYSFRDRMCHHIAWDHRRWREALLGYEGAVHYFEGKITFKQDVTLDDLPGAAILLGIQTRPSAAAALLDDLVIVKDADKGLLLSEMKVGAKTGLSGMVTGFAAIAHSPIGYIGIIPLQGEWGYNYGAGRLTLGVGRPRQTIKAGDSLEYAFVAQNLLDEKRDGSQLEMLRKVYAEADYPCKVQVGESGETGKCFLNIKATDHEAVFTVGPKPGVGIDFPVKLDGVVDNGCAAVSSTVRPWFRFIGVMDETESAYFQEPMDQENEIWAGNVFVADNPALRFTLVVDGQPEGAAPFLEVHNPTDQSVKATIRSPKNAPLFGGTSFELTVPAKDSLFYDLKVN